MTIAAWESYIENVVIEATNALGSAAGVAGVPPAVPVQAWARHAFALRRAEIVNSTKKFNTPNATNVRDLLVESLEFNPWPSWSWRVGPRQWDDKEMRARLNGWVQVRHSIAHGFPLPNDLAWIRNAGGQPHLNLYLLRQCRKLFARLVVQTDAAFAAFLQSHHAVGAPW